jgi:hypothetical protein
MMKTSSGIPFEMNGARVTLYVSTEYMDPTALQSVDLYLHLFSPARPLRAKSKGVERDRLHSGLGRAARCMLVN